MTTPFRPRLENICHDVEGAVLATVMGLDGLPVDTVAGQSDIDVAALVVEYSSLLEQVRRTAQVLAAGNLEELTIRSNNLTTIIRLVTDTYFLAVAVQPLGLTGKARFYLKRQVMALIAELS